MLTQWGYDAVVASDGEEAWRLLQGETSPRLVILDWLMPGLDGLEVCRRIRSSHNGPYIYVLVLTGMTSSADLVAAMEAGADDFISKPIRSAELRARLRAGCRILELEERRRTAGDAPFLASPPDPSRFWLLQDGAKPIPSN
jgi:DNA-binding response OmpR family regulator